MELRKMGSEKRFPIGFGHLGVHVNIEFRECVPISCEWIIHKQENKTAVGGLNLTRDRFPHGCVYPNNSPQSPKNHQRKLSEYFTPIGPRKFTICRQKTRRERERLCEAASAIVPPQRRAMVP